VGSCGVSKGLLYVVHYLAAKTKPGVSFELNLD
jgi:hypothetical protein